MSDNESDSDFEYKEQYEYDLGIDENISRQLDFMEDVNNYLKVMGLRLKILNNMKELDLEFFLDKFFK